MVLVIDNYDSFTYNIVQILGELGAEMQIYRNDALNLDQIAMMAPKRILLSPGPRSPAEAGICVPLIQRFAGAIPILGVCLGHQAIGAAFGGQIVRADRLMHGKASQIHHTNQGVFQNLPSPFSAIRYHSLLIERDTVPEDLEVTAETEEGEIMGIRHKVFPVEGVQFHPESILSEAGYALFENFLKQQA